MRKKNGVISSGIKGIKIMVKNEPKMLLTHVCFTVAHGLSIPLQVITAQKFFDAAERMVTKGTSYSECFLYLLFMILAYGIYQVMNGVDNCHAKILSLAFARHINALIFKRVELLDCSEFEDTNRLDFINKSVKGSENLFWVSLVLLDTVFFYTTYFIFMSWYLITLKPVLCLSIVLAFIPSILSKYCQISFFEKLENEAAPIRRESQYYEKCTVDIREVRLLGATEYFNGLYKNAMKKLNHLIFKANLKKGLLNLTLDIITVIGYGVVIYMLFYFVMKQEISVGAFAAVLASLGSLFNYMSEVILERIGWAAENTSTVKNLLEFIEEKPERNAMSLQPSDSAVTLQDVNFRYPFTQSNALKSLNLKIKRGQTVALVGENGSGKSTLCRIILGLYQPTSGSVVYGDSINRKTDSAVFQDFCRYKFTLKKNIMVSKIDQAADDCSIADLCCRFGLDLDNNKFPNYVNTMLGREFDGIELSIGQWQRIAIARGLFRESNFIVLDEPTSAIDPLEESRFYHTLADICQDKTAFIVTHRLGSARFADRIIVLKSGEIIEDGNHDELMNLNGVYKEMFESQKKWYL